jgi:hypothetical protein
MFYILKVLLNLVLAAIGDNAIVFCVLIIETVSYGSDISPWADVFSDDVVIFSFELVIEHCFTSSAD